MNGRTTADPTPEGRIAAAVKTLQVRHEERFPRRLPEYRTPDYADYRDFLKIFIERELVAARLDELKRLGERDRKQKLEIELIDLDLKIELLK